MKRKLMIPIILILIMLLGILTGCYERVETEGYEYNEPVVTLKGSAPIEDLLGRVVDFSQLEFRFYNKKTDEWDDDYRTVEKDYWDPEGDRVYFSADVDDLEPNTRYYVRALGYYLNPNPDDPIDSGWGYSVMMDFIPSDQQGTTESIQTGPIDFTNNVKLRMILELLMKNPVLKERLFNRFLEISELL